MTLWGAHLGLDPRKSPEGGLLISRHCLAHPDFLAVLALVFQNMAPFLLSLSMSCVKSFRQKQPVSKQAIALDFLSWGSWPRKLQQGLFLMVRTRPLGWEARPEWSLHNAGPAVGSAAFHTRAPLWRSLEEENGISWHLRDAPLAEHKGGRGGATHKVQPIYATRFHSG